MNFIALGFILVAALVSVLSSKGKFATEVVEANEASNENPQINIFETSNQPTLPISPAQVAPLEVDRSELWAQLSLGFDASWEVKVESQREKLFIASDKSTICQGVVTELSDLQVTRESLFQDPRQQLIGLTAHSYQVFVHESEEAIVKKLSISTAQIELNKPATGEWSYVYLLIAKYRNGPETIRLYAERVLDQNRLTLQCGVSHGADFNVALSAIRKSRWMASK